MSICLLRDLERGEFETAVFLTYTVGLRFFEDMIVHRLHRLGVGRIGIIVDPHGYRQSIQDPLQPEGCGRLYAIEPARLTGGGIQHAKLLWLQGRDRQIAYVGSHNLTAAGFNDQFECTTKIDSDIPGHRTALRDIHSTVSRIVPPRLDKIWAQTTPPEAGDAEPTLRFISSLDAPLLDQLVDMTGGSAHRLRVITPFIDKTAFHELIGRLTAATVVLDVPADGTDISVSTVIAGLQNVTVRQSRGRQKDQRHLHAKAYEIAAAEREYLAQGSANCTQAALMRAVHQGGNLEFLTVLEPGVLPEDQGPVFEEVADVSTVPATGRSWDADRTPGASLVIDSAVYRDGSIEVRWHDTSHATQVDIVLSVNGQKFGCIKSPFQAALDAEPSTVSLSRGWNAQPLAHAWVVYPDVLDAQVHRRLQQRWIEHLESEDPRAYAVGLDRIFDQMVRDVRGLLDEDDESAGNTLSTVIRQANPRVVREAVETFAFSPDPIVIHRTAAQLVGSQGGTSPFVILLGLLARHGAPAPSSLEDDPEGLERYERRRREAGVRMADHLLRYLGRLSGTDVDWNATAPKRARICLLDTFSVVAALWHRADVKPRLLQHRDRFAELVCEVLRAVRAAAGGPALLHDEELVGPLLFGLGAAWEAAEKDSLLRQEFRSLAKEVAVPNAREALDTWRENYPSKAELLGISPSRVDQLARWRMSVEKLCGLATSSAQLKIQQRWGLLLQLEAAERKRSPESVPLRAEAARRYRGSNVWIKYVSASSRHRFPVVRRVSGPLCDLCRVSLPGNSASALMRGEAVTCERGHVLLLAS